MRGPKARVLTDLAKLNEDRPDDARPMPELQHNMDLLVEMTESEIKNAHAKLKTTEDMAALMEKEEQRLLDEMEERRQEIDRRLALQSRLESQIRPLDPIAQYDALLRASQEIQTEFSVEYNACRVPMLLLDKVRRSRMERGAEECGIGPALLRSHVPELAAVRGRGARARRDACLEGSSRTPARIQVLSRSRTVPITCP